MLMSLLYRSLVRWYGPQSVADGRCDAKPTVPSEPRALPLLNSEVTAATYREWRTISVIDF